MKKYTAEELNKILELHKKWLNNQDGGGRADLSGANLRNADLRGSDLSGANLRGADLSNADLSNANLRGADLRGADLSNADLSNANLSNADLRGSDLSGANLRGADLSNADLSNANGNMLHVKSLQTETYFITYTAETIQIGCQRHTIEEWKNLDNKQILEMDGRKALEWWNKWKPILMQIIEMSPCEPTKGA